MHQINYTVTFTIVGSPDLYHAVRAGFVNQGSSLNKWCTANGVKRQTAEKALRGERRSIASALLLDEILIASGISKALESRM